MSFIKHIQKHIPMSDVESQEVFKQVQKEMDYSLICGSNDLSLKNKNVVAVFRKAVEEKVSYKLKQQKAYEILSQLCGLKNYNVALSKAVDFSSLFIRTLEAFRVSDEFKTPDFKISYNFETGVGKSTLLDAQEVFNIVNNRKNKIPTGISNFDVDLGGGFSRGELVTVLLGKNMGKSIALTSIASQAILSSHKVLHINFSTNNLSLQYTSNLSKTRYKNIATGELSTEEKERINDTKKDFSQSLEIKTLQKTGFKIEEVVWNIKKSFESFKFDMVVLNFTPGQIYSEISSSSSEVARGLSFLAKELNCVVVIGSGCLDDSPILRSSNNKHLDELREHSSVIFSINRTDNEVQEGQMRLFLEKQSYGVKNKMYGVLTDYATCNVIAGEYPL